MKTPLCELIASFVADPKGLASEVRSKRDEIFSHLDICDTCADRMDTVSDPDRVLEVLAAEDSTLTAEESRQVDDLVRADAAREDEVRRAVEDALLPSLGRRAASVGKEYDPLALYGATEGVSLLIRSHITMDHPKAELVQLHTDGAISIDLKSAIPAKGVALQIARFTGFWTPAGLPSAPVERAPSDKARALTSWVFDAARDQRHLLRHFSVDPIVSREDALTLVPLAPGERIDDPLDRWRPEKTEELEALVFVLAEGKAKVCLFGIAVDSLGTPLRPERVGMTTTSMQKPVCNFLTSKRFVEGIRTTARSTRKFLLPDGSHRETDVLGVFEEVAFEGREIRVTAGGRVMRGRAERTVFPAGVLP